jgi:hypothetical protein
MKTDILKVLVPATPETPPDYEALRAITKNLREARAIPAGPVKRTRIDLDDIAPEFREVWVEDIGSPEVWMYELECEIT